MFNWFFSTILTRLARIEAKVDVLLVKEMKMAADLTAITKAVNDEKTVSASAVTLLTQLSAQIATLKNDPVALQSLADQLNTQSATLAAAVTANTPA